MKSFIFASCIAATLAAPTSWSPEMAAFYSETSLQILQRRASGDSSTVSCDLSKLNITAYLASIPDAPAVKDSGKAKLVQVTMGRGVQNYTCADNKDSTKPVAIGAVANLYNISCIAVNYPQLLNLYPAFGVQYNTTLDANGKMPFTDIERSGHHYFNAAGNPVFDLNDDKDNQLGVIIADAKNADMKVNAPVSAIKGQVTAFNGLTGAVPWLKLNPLTGTTGGLTEVYRVDTAGGSAPANCSGQPSLISVQYAAQYWFFKSV